jgi:hypothetical protein
MIEWTIEVSDHPSAATRPAPQAAIDSWRRVHHGPLANAATARKMSVELAQANRHVRVFRIGSKQALGKMVLQFTDGKEGQ